MIKPFLISLAILVGLMWTLNVSAAPSLVNLGNASSTALSANVFCLTSDACRTTWPASSAFPFTVRSYGVSTSTTIGLLNGFLSTASSTIDSNLIITGNSTTTNATTTNFAISSLTSALLQTDANGSLSEYAGTSCTNQFVRSLSVLGAATCATVGSADVSLANLTATDSTLTFSGTYNGSTARTIGINLANPNTWTGLQTITNASTTALTASSFFQVPVATSFSNFMQGTLHFDTTSNNLVMGTSTSPSTSQHVVVDSATTTLYAFAVASTSPDFISGGVIELPAHHLAQVAVAVICKADAGTSVVINLSNIGGTSDTNTATCTTTSTQFNFTANNSYAAYAPPRLEVGTVTGAVDRLSIRIVGYRTSN